MDCDKCETEKDCLDSLKVMLNESMELNEHFKSEVEKKNQVIYDLLDLSKRTTKELKCAKSHETEKVKEQESHLSSLEKRLNKLDAEKEDLNKKINQLQAKRIELLEKNLKEKEEKLQLSDLRNSVSQKIIGSLQTELKKKEGHNDVRLSALQSQLDQALTMNERLKIKLTESDKKCGLPKTDAPSRARNENRKLSAKVDELIKKLDDVTREKNEFEEKLKLAEKKLSNFCMDKSRRKKKEKSDTVIGLAEKRVACKAAVLNYVPRVSTYEANETELELRSLLEAEKMARLKYQLVAELHDDSAKRGKLHQIRDVEGSTFEHEE